MFDSIKNFFRKNNKNTQVYQAMKFDDFMQETLDQIVSGVSEAQVECQTKKYGAVISPKKYPRRGRRFIYIL